MRRIILTKSQNVQSLEQMSSHPNVRKFWNLTWGYVFFEFYDPVYESLYEPNLSTDEFMAISKELRPQLQKLEDEKRKLLWPLYAGERTGWQGNQFGLPLLGAFYQIVGKRKVKWPWFGCTAGWEMMNKIRIVGKLTRPAEKLRRKLEKTFAQWADWAKSVGELKSMSEISYVGEAFTIECDFFKPCADSCVALLVLLPSTFPRNIFRSKGIEGIGFFDLQEEKMGFFEIGRPNSFDLDLN